MVAHFPESQGGAVATDAPTRRCFALEGACFGTLGGHVTGGTNVGFHTTPPRGQQGCVGGFGGGRVGEKEVGGGGRSGGAAGGSRWGDVHSIWGGGDGASVFGSGGGLVPQVRGSGGRGSSRLRYGLR